MFKFDKIRNYFDCDQCSKVLVEPITLTCGNSLCKKHLDDWLKDLSKERSTFDCELCHDEHSIPKKGFAINKRMQSGLEAQFDSLELPVFDECKKEIENAKENIIKIDSLEKNAENYIFEYFEDIKRQVDLRREDLKSKIDQYSDETIQSIERSKSSYIKLSKEVNRIATNIDKSKTELDEFVKQLDTLKIDVTKFESIKSSVSINNGYFKDLLLDFNASLLDYKDFSFEFKETAIKDIFGSFVENENTCLDSTILNTKYLQYKLNGLCQLSCNQKWKLEYRASRDGFGPEDFHSKVDGKVNTLTVIKSTEGNIFGGFTGAIWDHCGLYGGGKTDTNAFIFSLINKEKNPFKVTVSESSEAIFCHSSCGPVFGSGYDIKIDPNSNSNTDSYSDFGGSYRHQDYPEGSTKAENILAGSNKFKTVDIEVFSKVC